jgi:Domain of unknown function (DUF3943)
MLRRSLVAMLLMEHIAVAQSAAEDCGLAGSQECASERIALDPDRPILSPWRFPLVFVESLATLIPPTLYYWNTTSLQREDWEMKWDWKSWKSKLTSVDSLALDTGYWDANAIRHPIAGALTYQIARANGLGWVAATVVDLATAATWEYLVEFKERISVNDLVVNSLSGFALGEPLFQIGRAADARAARWARRLLGWITSPVHQLQQAAGQVSWRAPGAMWTEFEIGVGGRATDLGASTVSELSLTIDLELVRDRRYGRAGSGSRWLGAGTWNRIAGEVLLSSAGASRVWVHSATTYVGSYRRAIDRAGVGTDRFLGVAAAVDYDSRRLVSQWDHMLVFHVVGPRLALGAWSDGRRLLWETAASADLGMVRAHVFGPISPFPSFPLRSVLQARGYYYATGASLSSRLRVTTPPWFGQLEVRAQQFWSIDGHDRVELGSGVDDPHDIADQRANGRAAFGVRPGQGDDRLELTFDVAIRRGTWNTQRRLSSEVGIGAGVVVSF